jgi:glycosyltransferase involved in cell wall biosynthesis
MQPLHLPPASTSRGPVPGADSVDTAFSGQGLRVVHAANYQFKKDGLVFFNPDLKLHQGLVQHGCFVYPFSINDRARMLSLTGSKTFGKRRCNAALIKACRNISPDLLILGHAQYITRDTLDAIRNELPDIRIGLWFFDALWSPENLVHIHERADVIDAVFATSSGPHLQSLSHPGCPSAFIPNPVEPSVERLRAFENPRPRYDLVFFGMDKRAGERRRFLEQLVEALPDAELGIFGSLGNSPVFGAQKERIFAESRMALNLNRQNTVELYSSDRIAQLTGNGLVVLTPEAKGFEQLFSRDEVVYFRDVGDLAAQVRRLKADDAAAIEIARAGWQRAHECYSTRNVAAFIVALTMRDEHYRQFPWSDHVFWSDAQSQAA